MMMMNILESPTTSTTPTLAMNARETELRGRDIKIEHPRTHAEEDAAAASE